MPPIRLRRAAPLTGALVVPAALIVAAAVAPWTAKPTVAQPPAETKITLTTAKPAPLDYKITTLKNGLKVVVLEDRRAPVATLQVWYRVGSAEEPKGKFGFAHLFEHMMFKGSKNVAPEQHARYVEALGADYNADTFFDRTRYYETVPVNALERILFLEADRMASLNVDAANLKTETDVVKEELRVRVENAPYGKLLENILAQVYPTGHPYAHTTIGSIADLESAKLADVQAFHAEYYRPDNATLVLVGDFKTADALALIEKYFGGIPKSPTGKFTRFPVAPDSQQAETRKTYTDKLAPLPLVGMAYRLPEAKDPDIAVVDVITRILSDGQSSRLYRSLVREKQLAAQAGGEALNLRLGGLYFFFAIANPGKAPADIEKALQAEVERLQNTPVSSEELIKAKNQILSGLVIGRISTVDKANAIGQADLDFGDPAQVNREFEQVVKVTPADIQRVAKKYFATARRNVFAVMPEAKK
jgi:zinc protease